MRNEGTSLSGISSITIDTVSFYSHVRQLHWNDKFACRRAPRNSTTMRANLVAIFRYTRRVTILETSFTTLEWDRSRTNGLHITGLCLEGKVLFASVNVSAHKGATFSRMHRYLRECNFINAKFNYRTKYDIVIHCRETTYELFLS